MKLIEFFQTILKPYKIHIFGLFVTALLWAFMASIGPMLLKIIINNLTENKTILVPAASYVFWLLMTVLNFRGVDLIKYRFLPFLKRDIACFMFGYMKGHSQDFFQNTFAGTLSKKIDDMVVNFESLVVTADEITANILALLVAIISMGFVNLRFALILLAWFLFFFIVSHFFSKTILKLAEKQSAAYSLYSGTLVDIFSNISSVKLFARQDYESRNLAMKVDNLVEKDKETIYYTFKMRLVQDTSILLLMVMMMYQLVNLYQSNQVTIGDFAFILTLTSSIFQAIWSSASKIIAVYRSVGRCKQALYVLNEPHAIKDISNAKALILTQGAICFENVSFYYNPGQPIFTKTNLAILAGEKVGLVGFSGSGKTTFINLILRSYDVQSGRILIDNQDIAQVAQSSLKQNISMIPQDIMLFHRTLFENISYGDPAADTDTVITAAKKAHCHDFITALPDGYQTFVGERGIKLSGGQRQRIAIARAILENAPILILDEATSALDSVTERQIQTSLKYAMKDRTTIVVAHRLSTLLEMDRILVFDEGTIIEDGNHNELIQKNGHYKKMWNMQTNGLMPDSDCV